MQPMNMRLDELHGPSSCDGRYRILVSSWNQILDATPVISRFIHTLHLAILNSVDEAKIKKYNGPGTWHSHPEYQLSYKSVSLSVRERLRLLDEIIKRNTTHPHAVIRHLLSHNFF
jgi:hypothetical protein